MATMWPKTLPRSVQDNPLRSAEVRVYTKLREVLDDNFHVFYSSPWLGTDNLGNEIDGECDFLVAHPNHGFLAIEVKGGGVSFDPATDQWRSKDRNGFEHKIKNPIDQARNAKHRILHALKESRWRSRRIHIAHGVILPDAATPSGDLGADRKAELFCASKQFHTDLLGWISQRLKIGSRPRDCEPIGNDGILALEQLLARPFTLSFRIGSFLAQADEELRYLETAQFHVLETIADLRRVLVSGGAGTGKTIVAIEASLRSAKSGRKTLLTCHSRPLATYLSRTISQENLTIMSFHAVCVWAAQNAGIHIPAHSDASNYFYNELPNLLDQAMSVDPSLRWDTIVVDEGQDFAPHWWLAVDSCLHDNGYLRVFMDSNQAVYGSAGAGLRDLEVQPVRLSRNLRNTKTIHAASMVHYSGPEIIPDGPDGQEVIWIEADEELKVRSAYAELRRLVFTEDVSPGDIAVLVNDSATRQEFLALLADSRFAVENAENMTPDGIVLDTVRRFKGLDRPAVLVISQGKDLGHRELAYVAFSRARAYLAVVGTVHELKLLRSETHL